MLVPIFFCKYPHADRSASAILERIVSAACERHMAFRRDRDQGPDAGFALPEVYECCEKEGIGYTPSVSSGSRASKPSPKISWSKPNGSPRSESATREGASLVCRSLVSSG
jgi:hypothetical protein